VVRDIAAPGGAESDSTIELRFADGTAFRCDVERVRRGRLGGRVYRGRLASDPTSWFVLARIGDVMAGEMASAAGGFALRYVGGGRHVLRPVDRTARLNCDSVELPAADHAGPPPKQSGGASLIDVMIVYTPSSRVTVGGTEAIEALIESYFEYTDMVHEQSGVAFRFRLVHAQEVDYVESGNSLTDLARLRAIGDGFMDEVHPLRDQFGADLVSLINTSGSAGVGYTMQELSPAFECSAFSAIGAVTDPIPGGLVFAHETGHNMGCNHNNFPGAPPGVFCYSFGYRTPDEQWRTIMSSSPGAFVDVFSSPNLEIDGQPLGVAGDGCPPDAADNVRSLNEAAATVAGFRPATVPCGADFDCDGDVDLFDFEAMATCTSGPDTPASPECLSFDFDADGDVDRADARVQQTLFTG
jgi:hypothetical protein